VKQWRRPSAEPTSRSLRFLDDIVDESIIVIVVFVLDFVAIDEVAEVVDVFGRCHC
jgi:hypothetical protein